MCSIKIHSELKSNDSVRIITNVQILLPSTHDGGGNFKAIERIGFFVWQTADAISLVRVWLLQWEN